MAPTYKLKIIRVPLPERPPDIKPNFPKLDNLHLDLLENKKRLKPGLPPIPITKIVPKPQNVSPSKTPVKTTAPSGVKEPSKGTVKKPIIPKKEEDDEDMKEFQDDEISPRKESKTDVSEIEIGIEDDEEESPVSPPPHKGGSPKEHQEEAEEENYEPEPEATPQEPQLSPEDQEREDISEYKLKLKMLKRQYPKYAFPEWSDHTDLPTLKSIYSESFKECTMDENVELYKKFLYGGFIAIEVLARKIGMTSFAGFAKYQMQKKEKYERLLIELGEKSYINFANNWPVELKLVGMLLLDAGLFYLGKIVTDYAGEEMASMIFETFGIPLPKKKSTKARMRGPSTRPEDIRKMAGKG